MKNTVLIAGASIAGLTIAYWLNHYGYNVTIVEISSGLRKGGASIDVRDEALVVAERMGILDKITTAVQFVDAQNKCIAAMKNFGEDALGQDIELHRNHLVEIIYEAAKDVEYLFNNRIKTIDQHNSKVSVVFEEGQNQNLDLVVGADGVHSTVRKMIFGEESFFNHYFEAYFAILKAGESLGKVIHGQIYNLPNKMAATSDKGNSMLLFRSPKLAYNYRNDAEHKKILEENFAGCGWKIPAILKAMTDSEILYFDGVCQIKMSSWTKGRVALIGDAAHCTGFPTSMGTSLAMQGATLLANELMTSNGDYNLAFSKYDELFHPIVEIIQATIINGMDFLVPATKEGINLRNEMVMV
jgi:2-polyprenyl-6-methoxyphenol hydroxylase-like FAD-dependent oxidoreductase